jgi:Amt family ammonium transporter
MGELHHTLVRQLRRLGLSTDQVPDLPRWVAFLGTVSASYQESDRDRELLAHSLDVSSQEMRELYDELRQRADRQLETERDRLQAVFDAAATALLVVDVDGTVTAANPEAVRLLGDHDLVVGRPLWELLALSARSDRARHRLLDAACLQDALANGGWAASDLMAVGPAGRPFPTDCTVVPFHADDRVAGAVVVLADNSEREAARARLAWQATHDALTSLPNRTLLLERLDRALREAPRAGGWPAVLFLDLDRFKNVNDSLGHAAGDHLLVLAADRIARVVRAGDTVARMGGDEFVVMCDELSTALEARQAAERIRQVLTQPFVLGGEEAFVSVSIGVALADATYRTADELLRDADIAMYRAKDRGRNRIEVFDSELRQLVRHQVSLERGLRHALDRGEMGVVYQPIVRVSDGLLVGFEALLRWDHPTEGPIPPEVFIPLAEETGMMGALGDWVLDVACRDAASWQVARGTELSVHVNLSGRQLASPQLISSVADTVTRHHLAPKALTLEIAESTLLEDPELAMERLGGLVSLGIALAIEDFGAGYSSLAYLRTFPLRTVKIDRAFVSSVPASPQDRRIVQAIIDLSHGLGYEVIAVGVEQDAELVVLQELGCDMAQGWLFGHPLPGAEALLVAAAATAQTF